MSDAKYVPRWKRGAGNETTVNVTVTVKVGLDEWIIVNAPSLGKEVDLCTDGLSGCVGLVLISDKQACLAHVFSDCDSEQKWAKYKAQLERPLAAMQIISPLAEAAAVSSEGSVFWLRDKLVEWISPVVGTGNVRLLEDRGVRVSASKFGGWTVLQKSRDGMSTGRDNDIYIHGFLGSSNAGANIVAWGKLSDRWIPAVQ
jgi:hypothetical protein